MCVNKHCEHYFLVSFYIPYYILLPEASAFVIVNVKFEKPDGTSDTKRFKVGTSDRMVCLIAFIST